MAHRLPFRWVRVFGQDVAVRLVPAAQLPKDRGQLTDKGILLSDGPHPDVARTACHELVEAWNYGAELGLTHRQITVLEGLLFETLRANRAFVRFVQWARWK